MKPPLHSRFQGRFFLLAVNSVNLIQLHSHYYILTGAKRREWMGCWGLLGLIVIVDHILIPYV